MNPAATGHDVGRLRDTGLVAELGQLFERPFFRAGSLCQRGTYRRRSQGPSRMPRRPRRSRPCGSPRTDTRHRRNRSLVPASDRAFARATACAASCDRVVLEHPSLPVERANLVRFSGDRQSAFSRSTPDLEASGGASLRSAMKVSRNDSALGLSGVLISRPPSAVAVIGAEVSGQPWDFARLILLSGECESFSIFKLMPY